MTRAAAAWAIVFAMIVAFAGRASLAQDTPFGPAGDIELELREGMTLVDAGRPVATARAAYAVAGAGPAESESRASRADESGRVRVPRLAEPGNLLVWAPGKAPFVIGVGAAVPLRVPMQDGIACDVLVTTMSGDPIAGVVVTADVVLVVSQPAQGAPQSHRYTLTSKTDAAGRVRFADVPDVTLSLVARAEGFVDAAAYPVDPKRGATLVLGRGSRVAGSLRMQPGDLAAEGATAKLGARTAPVQGDGAFVFETVPPGAWVLTFEGRGFVPGPPRTLVLEDGRDRTGLHVVVARVASLPGRVVAPKDRLVTALRLVFDYPPGAAPETSREAFVKVAADGTFTVTDLPACDGVVLTAWAPGFVPALVGTLSLPSGESAREVEVTLVAGGTLAGRVAAEDDAPVADAAVVVSADPRGVREWGRTTTGEDGSFSVDGVAAGDAWVRVVGRPVGSDMAFGPFRVVADERTDAGTLRGFAGWRLDGTVPGAPDGVVVVVRANGADVARATVADGEFGVPGLAAGPVELRAEFEGDVVGTESASLPAAWPVVIPYSPPVPLRGRIVDADGRPVVNAVLRAERLDGAGSRKVDVRDPEGRFELKLLRGRWRLDADAITAGDGGGGASGVRELILPDDAGRDVVLILEPGATLRGAVLRGGGPLEGAVVRALVVGDQLSRAVAQTDAAGRFTLPGVPAGVVKLRVETPDRSVYTRNPIVVREGEELDAGTIELPRGTRVRGEVWAAGGQPLARGEVEFDCDGGTQRTAVTDPWGRFDLDGVPPGPAIVSVRDEGRALVRMQQVDVPWTWEDWRLRIDIDAGVRVFGRVQTAGRDEAFATVTLRITHPTPVEVSAVADAQGRYALPPVAPGVGEIDVAVVGAGVPWRRPARIARAVEQMLDIDLPEASVQGVVETSDGGWPVIGAFVELRSYRDPRPVASGWTGVDGRFDLPRVRPGTFDLVATATGHGPAWIRGVTVARTSGVAGLRVALPPSGGVVLRAVDTRARGISGAWARAWRDADDEGALRGPMSSALADADGRIVLRGLSRGKWRVALGAPGRSRLDLGWVQVDEGERDLGGFELGRGAMLRVLTVSEGPGGRRLGGIEVDLFDATGADPRPLRRPDDALRGPDPLYVTDERGLLEVPGLARGTYRVRPAGRRDAETRVFVREGQVATAYVAVPLLPPDDDDGTPRDGE